MFFKNRIKTKNVNCLKHVTRRVENTKRRSRLWRFLFIKLLWKETRYAVKDFWCSKNDICNLDNCDFITINSDCNDSPVYITTALYLLLYQFSIKFRQISQQKFFSLQSSKNRKFSVPPRNILIQNLETFQDADWAPKKIWHCYHVDWRVQNNCKNFNAHAAKFKSIIPYVKQVQSYQHNGHDRHKYYRKIVILKLKFPL